MHFRYLSLPYHDLSWWFAEAAATKRPPAEAAPSLLTASSFSRPPTGQLRPVLILRLPLFIVTWFVAFFLSGMRYVNAQSHATGLARPPEQECHSPLPGLYMRLVLPFTSLRIRPHAIRYSLVLEHCPIPRQSAFLPRRIEQQWTRRMPNSSQLWPGKHVSRQLLLHC